MVKSVERVIAFQGERGAHSEAAVEGLYGEVGVLPCRTLRGVFEAVQEGKAHAGMVPVENSQAGTINETWDLLLEHSLWITGETEVPIRHCLMALPGQSLADIRMVYSHPQALAQCQGSLREMDVDMVAVYDTAGSAKMLRERALAGVAAIAGERAAEIYQLAILARDLQDQADNRTRFFAIAREPVARGERNRTALVMATQHRPGALYWCLGALAYRDINLVKLESRPSRNKPWDYIFYILFDGHADDAHCQEALAELRTKTSFLRVLGSYPCANGV